jgi:hypothetical protein
MRRAALLLLVGVGVGLGLVQGYSVAPRTAAWSGWTQQYGNVSQLVTCNFDYLDSVSSDGYVELFQGDTSGTGTYLLNIYGEKRGQV